jgi:8-amino-7-oxononanoate synthase
VRVGVIVAVTMSQSTTDVFEPVRTDDQVELQRRVDQGGVSPFFRELEGAAGPTVTIEGSERIMLASNNYLGLTDDPRVVAAAKRAVDDYGAGLTGSRLLNGTTRLHRALEDELAHWYGTEAAVVTTTGYQANLAVMSSIPRDTDSVVFDSADHASILDGLAMTSARLRPFRHSRLDKLEAALRRAAAAGGGILVVVDGVFSMEGDIANVAAIAELCQRYGARLAVDEAHAVGVLGERGTGASELWNVEDQVDIRIGTFSKSLATCGGFVAASQDVVDFLRTRARPFLFTAASVPAAVGAALEAVRICRSDEGRERFAALLANARYLHDGLKQLGLHVPAPSTGPDGDPLVTPIVPVVVGEDSRAVVLWKALWDHGVFANVALHPAVQEGQQLLRLSVMSTHTREHLDGALEAFEKAVPQAEAQLENMRALAAL